MNQERADIPRKTALLVLNAMSPQKHLHLDRIITDVIDNSDLNFSHRDRNFINILIFGVLRWRETLDWIIRQHSKTRIEKINPKVLNILRLGLYQIFFLDRVPDSAAVNTSVEMAKRTAPPWVVKYVNAVLRNAIRNRNALSFPSMTDDPAEAISISKSFPLWLTKRWVTRFGIEESEKLCEAFNKVPPITVRCNTLKVRREELMEILRSETEMISPTPCSPDGLFFEHPNMPIHEFSSFKKGLFQVQDEAAQLVAYLLAPQPDEKILDACAGLGGKTGHIAQLMKNRGQIIAADREGEKLLRLNTVMQRIGAVNVTTCPHDFNNPVEEFAHREFDRILIDAPCSGTGVIRRNPDTKWNVTLKNLKQCGKNQLNLLQNISPLVKVGGTMVYVVCSFEPEENEWVVSKFLKTHNNFELRQKYSNIPFDISLFVDSDGFFPDGSACS